MRSAQIGAEAISETPYLKKDSTSAASLSVCRYRLEEIGPTPLEHHWWTVVLFFDCSRVSIKASILFLVSTSE